MAAANVANTLIVPTESTVSPYYDDFSEAKNFQKIMFRPGYAVQARELTQLQTILQNQIERFGRHIFVNGSSVIGGKTDFSDVITLNVQSTYNNTAVTISNFKDKTIRYSSGNNEVMARVIQTSPATNVAPAAIHVRYLTGSEFGANSTVTTTDGLYNLRLQQTSNVKSEGSVAFIYDSIYFMQGYFIKVPQQTVVISKHDKKANCKVGLEYVDNIITEADDITLLDPALEASNYQAPGAGRYQVELVLAKRALDSEDDAKFIQIAKVEDGVIRSQVKTPIYSEIEEVMARRTYDESGNYIVKPFVLKVEESTQDPANNFTLTISPGKAYLYGFEVENQSETRIEIPRSRSTRQITNYNLNCNYGNYVIVDNLKGAFNTSGMGVVDLHCVTPDLINYGSSATYNSTKIGQARIKDLNFYSGEANTAARKFEFYFFDTKLNSLNASATATSSNTYQIVMNSSNMSAANDAYTGAYISIISGNSSGDLRRISGYNGLTKTANVYPSFTRATDSTSQFEIKFDIKSVDGFVSNSNYTTGASSNASASIHIQSKDDGQLTGNTYIYEQDLLDGLFYYPNPFVAPGTTGQSYTYRKVFNGIQFIAGNSAVLTAGTDEDFVGVTSTSNSEARVMDNFLVIVTDSAGSTRNVGDQVPVTSYITSSTPEQTTLSTGVSESFIATIYAKMNATDSAAQPRVKTLHLAQTLTFGGGSPSNTFINATGSNTRVYLTTGQVAIKNPSKTDYESLYISDVIDIPKIYWSESLPNTGDDLTKLLVVSDRFYLEQGHRQSYYDHAAIKLKPGYSIPDGWVIACCRYYSHTNDVGYFNVDSYPFLANTVYEEGKDIGTGYSIIPRIDGVRMSDVVDFRPVRPNASNTTNWVFTSVRTPVAATEFNSDYNHYLERRDIVTLSLNDTVTHTMGKPSAIPYFPTQPARTLLTHRLSVLPYTLTPGDIVVETMDHRRYTMEDISKIDRRLKNVEYGVSLNALEKSATDITIKDVDGLDRTKYAILAENFNSHLLGDTYASDYSCAVDMDGTFSPTGGVLMPMSATYNRKLVANTATATNVSTHDDKVLLAYKTVPGISQTTATKAVAVTSYLFATFRGNIITIPEGDVFRDIVNVVPTTINIPAPVTTIVYEPVYVPVPGGTTSVPVTPTGGGGGGPTSNPSVTPTVDRLFVVNDAGKSSTLHWNAAAGRYNTIAEETAIYGSMNTGISGSVVQTAGTSYAGSLQQVQNIINTSGKPNPAQVTDYQLGVVYNLYQEVLKRPPDAGGAAYWTEMMASSGWTAKDLREIFTTTATNPIDGEARGMVQGLSVNLNPSYLINDGYTTVRNTSTTTTLTPGTPINGSGSSVTGAGYSVPSPPAQLAMTPSSIGFGMQNVTATGQAATDARTAPGTIAGLYTTFFDRPPDEGGLAFWTQQQQNGMSMDQIVTAFKASPEYIAKNGAARY